MESRGEHGWGMGTMDPHGDGDVMVGHKVHIIRVHFMSHPIMGMLREWA
jgi:hypothetical protein